MEDDLLSIKSNSNVGGAILNDTSFLSYNLLIKFFIILSFILIIKHNVSTELLLVVITISILFIFLKVLFSKAKKQEPETATTTITASINDDITTLVAINDDDNKEN